MISFTPFPVLTTDRLILRKLSMDDAEEVFVQRSHPEIQKFIKREPAKNIDDAKAWLAMVLEKEANNESITWAIVLKGTTKLIGSICLWNIEKELDRAEVGYALHPDHFRQGIMGEAMSAITTYGFEVMKLKRIDAYTHKDNVASRTLLGKNGFERNLDFESAYGDQEELEYNVIYSLVVGQV